MSDGKSAVQNYRGTWNREHFIQIKVSVSKKIASEPRAACKHNRESITGVLMSYMGKYAKTAVTDKPASLNTRALRAREMTRIVSRLELILDKETTSLENIPENFKETERYQGTSDIVEALADAITQLEDIYTWCSKRARKRLFSFTCVYGTRLYVPE
jgi:hypothetical protein